MQNSSSSSLPHRLTISWMAVICIHGSSSRSLATSDSRSSSVRMCSFMLMLMLQVLVNVSWRRPSNRRTVLMRASQRQIRCNVYLISELLLPDVRKVHTLFQIAPRSPFVEFGTLHVDRALVGRGVFAH